MKRWMMLVLMLAAGCAKKEEVGVYSGTLELTEHSVGARVSGRLITVSVEEGATVKKGQELATLDRFAQQRREYDRLKALYDKGGTNRQMLEQASLTMEDQRLVAPVDGVVLLKVREMGEMVSAGATVVTIGDRSSLWVRIFIPQGEINKVKQGQSATVKLDGIDQTFPGKVTFIAPTAEYTPRNVQTPEERITQTFAVKVELTNPPEHVRPGVAADVRLQ